MSEINQLMDAAYYTKQHNIHSITCVACVGSQTGFGLTGPYMALDLAACQLLHNYLLINQLGVFTTTSYSSTFTRGNDLCAKLSHSRPLHVIMLL